MAFKQQYDVIFNNRDAETRTTVAVAKVAQAKQVEIAVIATPTKQQVRESLLAYDAMRSPESVARYFLAAGVAANGVDAFDATTPTDAAIEAFVLANWNDVAGVVDDSRADSTTPVA